MRGALNAPRAMQVHAIINGGLAFSVVSLYRLLHKVVPHAFQQELCRTVGKVALLPKLAGASLLHHCAHMLNKVLKPI